MQLLSQVFLVPLYLNKWSPSVYGDWLILQSGFAFATILDSAHQTYYENEYLRVGAVDRVAISSLLSAAIPAGLLLSSIQLIAIVCAFFTRVLDSLLGGGQTDSTSHDDLFYVLISWQIVWLLVQSVCGQVGRALSALGHYARFAWWGVYYIIASSLIPALVVFLGGGILEAGLAQAITTFLYSLLWLRDALPLLNRENIVIRLPQLGKCILGITRSSLVVVRQILDILRQQGFRLILSPLVGPIKVAEFATQRTVANVALQGLNSVYGPLMPELMRFVAGRQQESMEGIFAIIWSLLIFGVGPGIFLMQLAMPVVYTAWTRNAFIFDGWLFLILSASIVVYMISLPAMAICVGNNLLKSQLLIASAASIIMLVSTAIAVPTLSLRGAALALLVSEISATLSYIFVAIRWLRSVGLQWPTRMFYCTGCASVLILLLTGLVVDSHSLKWWPVISFIVFIIGAAFIGWVNLPMGVQTQFREHIFKHVRSL
ncbi:O-antigen/teichoic acid export membrane protein [Rhodoblastus sphagnicola]|uniref:lipopolysaccharide biosynthesis protein n=1 Tax=Rhodoblastus sphagnicola TaxID=333368 RepID=UPI0016088121|nr:hypothetical protein [Rhodoblastus sphagnicola]MBB4200561.1 O-antigen/teichoic acid export membrane protein [Rhodoblastus sphagnicola]